MKLVASAILFAGVAASSAAAVDRETDAADQLRQRRTRKRVSRGDSSASQIETGATSGIGARRSPLPSGRIQGNSQLFDPLTRDLREKRKEQTQQIKVADDEQKQKGRGRGQKSKHVNVDPNDKESLNDRNKRTSAKSDKSNTKSKSGKSELDTYHIAPFSCAGQCIDAEGADYGTGELSSAVRACNVHGSHRHTQQWIIHQDTTFVKAESYAYEGQCIGVDYEPGDSKEDIQGACDFAELALRPCDSPSTNWYFTGGQLLSAFCWLNGVTSAMGVFYDYEESGCREDLSLYSGATNTLLREDTFLFVDSNVMAMMEDSRPIPPDDGPGEGPLYFPTLNPTLSPTLLPTLNPTDN